MCNIFNLFPNVSEEKVTGLLFSSKEEGIGNWEDSVRKKMEEEKRKVSWAPFRPACRSQVETAVVQAVVSTCKHMRLFASQKVE